MKSILNLFRRNWGLKLLALILSLVVYYTMRNSANDNVTNNPFLKGASNGGKSN
jgi:hypothetical protein